MAAPEPNAAPYLTFPPFPKPPPGVTIIPFTEFKPLGIAIQTNPDDGQVEVDGLGIPTVTLNSRHDLTKGERRQGKKKLGNATTTTADGTVRKLQWHEEWATHTHSHKFSYNPREVEFERLFQASKDFKDSRPWPSSANPLLNLWDQIRLYIGLIASIQPPAGKRKKTQPVVEEEDEEEEVIDGKRVALDRVDDPAEGLKMARERREKAEKEASTGLWTEAEREEFREQRNAKRDQRMQEFLYDTETSVKIFFSAHFRDRGLAWDRINSIECPPLMKFWLDFLLAYDVFPEPEITRGLRRALTICEKAQVELPATFVIAKALEDGVSKQLQDIYGPMQNVIELWPAENNNNNAADGDNEEPDAKKPRVEIPEEVTGVFDVSGMPIEESLIQDSLADNGMQATWSTQPSSTDTWGNSAAMSNSNSNDATWGSTLDTADATTTTVNNNDDWAIKEDLTMRNLVGRVVDLLPTTHTTGVVERSTRRIVRVVKPDPTRAESGMSMGDDRVREVEEALESKLGYVVLAPWEKVGNHIASEVTLPIIQDSSRGEFDSAREETKVLLDPAVCDKLVLEMGMTATWVQLARRAGDDEDNAGESGKKGKKTKRVKNGEPTPWWYMEQWISAIPSFHTDRYYPNQD